MAISVEAKRNQSSAKAIAEIDKLFTGTNPAKRPSRGKGNQTGSSATSCFSRIQDVFGEFSPRWLGIENAFGRSSNVRNIENFVFDLSWRASMWEYFPMPMEGNFFYNLAEHWDYFVANPPKRFINIEGDRQPRRLINGLGDCSRQSINTLKNPTLRKRCSLDPIGYYSPAHFGAEADYGIHLSQSGLVNAANEIHQLCPKEHRSVVLATACHFAYCHLVVHAWIEDICSMLDFQYGCTQNKTDRLYTQAHCSTYGLLSKEEALCDMAAFGLLHRFLKQPSTETRKSRRIPSFNSRRIFEAFFKWRTISPDGKHNVAPITEPPHISREFVGGMIDLLHDSFKFDRTIDVGAVLTTFLGCNLHSGHGLLPSESVRCVDTRNSLNISDQYPVIVRLE